MDNHPPRLAFFPDLLTPPTASRLIVVELVMANTLHQVSTIFIKQLPVMVTADALSFPVRDRCV